ncbi:MAG: S53 family serine peptidase [Candidatus Acidiferrales bacterium]|jgi:subtilase family serine protease
MIRRLSASLLTIVAFLAVNIVCQAQAVPLMTRHVREAVRNGQARSVGHLPGTQTMRLVLVLPLRNQAELENFLQELYDPSSLSYRQFLTVEEFTGRFGPTPEDYDSVIHFAETNGLTVVGTSRNRLDLDVTGSVENIERALHVTMGVYQHPTENRTFYAPDREPTPFLSVQLWHIAGLENYSIPHPNIVRRNNSAEKSNASTGSGPSASFLGSDMRAAYYGGTALTGSGQSLGLLEYYGTDLSDLTAYYKNVGQTNNVPITLLSTDGTSISCLDSQGCDDLEQTIDMTQALGMAPGLSSLVMYIGSSDAAIFNAMATASPLNAQLSSSWTWAPSDASTDNPYFKEFAAQGQNLFQAAGDSGEWTFSSEIFPADDVYITSVGGTDLDSASAGGPWSSETAWSDGGGGISPDGYAIPSWQTATAAGCSACSQAYRNAPDVSANANFSFYVCADQTTCTANLWGGTSFAAPMWAGYLALVNQQAAANGNKPLGFINPALYILGLSSSYDTDFHDITSGSNGFSATTGYDLATGIGSPNGAALISALAGGSATSGFSLSSSPTTLSVSQGNSGTSTITSAVTGEFDSAISLSATGQPIGVSVAFNPTSITGAGTSVMTMSVSSTTTVGTYKITVTGSSGGTTETTTVTLKVTKAVPSFAISASPTSITVSKGATGNATITTTVSNGFNAAIALTAVGEGSAQTLTFSPSTIPAPGSGSSTMSVTVGAKATVGNHKITVRGMAGSVLHTTTVTLVVVD